MDRDISVLVAAGNWLDYSRLIIDMGNRLLFHSVKTSEAHPAYPAEVRR
jgi:hypothetical protein